MTIGQAIRLKCLECLGAKSGHSAFDCQSEVCALYPAHPFRGIVRENVTVLTDAARCAAQRRPSKHIVAEMCRQCNPDTADCTSRDCPLLPWTPFQPGGQPKKQISEKQHAARVASGRKLQQRLIPEA